MEDENWGDFKGDPEKLMERHFDAHVYVANWMTAIFMLRLPIEALARETAKAMTVPYILDFKATQTHWVITWSLEESENYDRFGIEDGRGWMAQLAPVRDELLRGDIRSLYIRWLAAVTGEMIDDDEKLWAFRQAFEDNVELPADGFVIGEPVSVIEVDYDGNERRGLTARCRREDGSDHVVAVSEVVFLQASAGARHIAAYRKWLNLDPFPEEERLHHRRKRQHKATADDLDLSKPVEMVALLVKERAARCRLLGSERVITLRASRLWNVVPGAIVTVKTRKQWRYAGHPYLSGEIQSTRIDVEALDLVPLGLADVGMWDPKEHYWGEEDEPIEEWAKPIIAHGVRPMFEMEQVLPGEDPDDPFDDPITHHSVKRS